MNFLCPHNFIPYEKSPYGGTSFFIRVLWKRAIKVLLLLNCGKGYYRPSPHCKMKSSRCRLPCQVRDTERIGVSKRPKPFEQIKAMIALVCGEATSGGCEASASCGFGRNSPPISIDIQSREPSLGKLVSFARKRREICP